MQLTTIGGKLRLRSAFKLLFWAWLLTWGSFASFIFGIFLIVAVVTGEANINGEQVQGLANILPTMLLMGILFPIIITFHAVFFGAFLTFGLFLYRLKRPINVVELHSLESNKPD